MNITKNIIYILFLLIISSTLSCNQNKVYDKYVEIENSIWNEDSLVNFEFEILTDTLKYNLFYNIRYGIGYPYYNLYISYYLEDSLGNSISTELQEIILFDKKTGEPQGDGVGNIFDREVLIFDKMKFPYAGKYQYKIKQFMRVKELPNIVSFGLKIEKVSNK